MKHWCRNKGPHFLRSPLLRSQLAVFPRPQLFSSKPGPYSLGKFSFQLLFLPKPKAKPTSSLSLTPTLSFRTRQTCVSHSRKEIMAHIATHCFLCARHCAMLSPCITSPRPPHSCARWALALTFLFYRWAARDLPRISVTQLVPKPELRSEVGLKCWPQCTNLQNFISIWPGA